MSVHPFSISNLLLLSIAVGLAGYIYLLWQLILQKATPAECYHFQKPVQRFALVYGGYLLLLFVLAGSGFFNVITTPPRFLLIFVPIVMIVILLVRAKRTGTLSFLTLLPPGFLIGIQAMRLLVELVFLRFAAEKIIPAELSLHGRNYDLLIGVLAIPVSVLFLKKHPWARKAGLLFNGLGLLSLANIFSIAIPSLPSNFRVYETLYLPTYFPGILIVFIASAALFIHILSVRQLMMVQSGKSAPELARAI